MALARREIRLTENPDGQWTARDLDAGVSAQGETREEALEMLDSVVAAVRAEYEGTAENDSIPLGTRLRGLAADVDVDPVDAVRELREDI